ncbi:MULTISPECIES: hypothetical protein [Mycobacteroides]|uniref:hypothetical protein n=1 Tax=Mycobacteroides TaxID=670516 RepID=UPI00092BA150|nr:MULTISPECIES: hypothetical protein [Mycobacteroides]MBF9435242.1 hypothetical protein [Mycobacteroides chelonae]MBN7504584.1 hypothetical protein [Mycobacteroides abscessus subsp. massiliense]MDO3037418.1 hypothetical protein [Mycobacteroides abscessus subsp. abscessus]MDO3111321.1 hypothetical protein [Mycobacteroides abscessus subsp. massiliense]MDO3260470.1 hypothetical protein [Mycobacteroides abscessus subsp. abscessus]
MAKEIENVEGTPDPELDAELQRHAERRLQARSWLDGVVDEFMACSVEARVFRILELKYWFQEHGKPEGVRYADCLLNDLSYELANPFNMERSVSDAPE